MALSQCLDCGREVSTRAQHCVHCGRPWPSSKCCSLGVVAGIGLAILIAVGAVTAISLKRKHDRHERTQNTQFHKAPVEVPAPVK